MILSMKLCRSHLFVLCPLEQSAGTITEALVAAPLQDLQNDSSLEFVVGSGVFRE